MIADLLFPRRLATQSGDQVDGPIPFRAGMVRLDNGLGARRDEVLRAIGGDAVDRVHDLGQEGRDLVFIMVVLVGDFNGDNLLGISIKRQVQFAKVAHYANGGYIGLWLEGADTSMVLDDFGGGKGLYSRALWPGPDPAIPPTGQIWKVYYYAGAQMIAMREISGTTQASTLYYLHSDHLGSTSLVTSITGTVVSRQSYYAYGGIRLQSGITPTDIGFTAQRNDNMGLMDFRSREFSVTLGRFVSADSIVPNPNNPQSLNRYSYVLNSPLRYTDPTGHFTVQEMNDFFKGWEDWSDVLKGLMLQRETTWGSILSLGWGGDEPAIMVMAVLEQAEEGRNSFFGSFIGLAGSDRGSTYTEDLDKLNKYTNGSVYFALKGVNGGYYPSLYNELSPHEQRGGAKWLVGNTEEDMANIVLRMPDYPSGAPGMGMAWYKKVDPLAIIQTSLTVAATFTNPSVSILDIALTGYGIATTN